MLYVGTDGLDHYTTNIAAGGAGAALCAHAAQGTTIDNPHWVSVGEAQMEPWAADSLTAMQWTEPRLLQMGDGAMPKRIHFQLLYASGDGAQIHYHSGYTVAAVRNWHFGMPYSRAPQAELQTVHVLDAANPLSGCALVSASLAHHSKADRLLMTDFGDELVPLRTGGNVVQKKRRWAQHGRTDKKSGLPVAGPYPSSSTPVPFLVPIALTA